MAPEGEVTVASEARGADEVRTAVRGEEVEFWAATSCRALAETVFDLLTDPSAHQSVGETAMGSLRLLAAEFPSGPLRLGSQFTTRGRHDPALGHFVERSRVVELERPQRLTLETDSRFEYRRGRRPSRFRILNAYTVTPLPGVGSRISHTQSFLEARDLGIEWRFWLAAFRLPALGPLVRQIPARAGVLAGLKRLARTAEARTDQASAAH